MAINRVGKGVSAGGEFASSDSMRSEAGEIELLVDDSDIVSEESSNHGRLIIRDYRNGVHEEVRKELTFTKTTRQMPDGSKTASTISRRYLHDSDGEVEEVLHRRTEESWKDGIYTMTSLDEHGGGDTTSWEVTSSDTMRAERWTSVSGRVSTMEVSLHDDEVLAVINTDGKTFEFRDKASRFAHPLQQMSAQAHGMYASRLGA